MFNEINLNLGQYVYLCKSCSFVYIWPDLTTKSLKEFYSTQYRKIYPDQIPFKNHHKFLKYRGSIAIAKFRYNFYKKKIKKTSKILEIGSGFGCFINELNTKHLGKILAFEPDKKYRSIGLNQNNKINFIENIKNKNLYNKFDIIFSFHVLEHIVNPHSFIKDCKKLLRKNGTLIIEVPDLILAFGSKKYFNTAHVSYYTKYTLSKLLEANYFSIEEMGNFDERYSCDSIYLIAKNKKTFSMAYDIKVNELKNEIKNNMVFLNKFTWSCKDQIKNFIIKIIIYIFGPSLYGKLKLTYKYFLK